MAPFRMIDSTSLINNKILNSRTQEDPQEDPQEVVEMTPVEEEVEMVEDHMIVTEDEIGEAATHRILL